MLRALSVLVFSLALLVAAEQAYAARIGVASVVKNDVSGSSGGKARVINVGSGVFQNEIIATGPASSAQLLFRDETSLTIGAKSRLTLDRFVYNPATKSGDVVVNALQGTFRFVSGSAKPGGYTIKTPVATVGLRGTIVEGYIASDGSLVLVVVEGSVVVTTADGTTVTLRAGQFITVSSAGVIGGPSDWTGPTLDLDAGQQFIFDSNEPNPNQRRELNDALDSRDLDLTFPPPPALPRVEPPPPPPPPPVDNRPPTDDLPSPGTTLDTVPSDARLKRDVRHVATLENGIRLYSFRYLWDETEFVGVMAQDLLSEPAYRHAVTTLRSGFYGVDYTALGLKMTTLSQWRKLGMSAIYASGPAATIKVRGNRAESIPLFTSDPSR